MALGRKVELVDPMRGAGLTGAVIAPRTRWEKAATTRWGRYLTDRETRAVQAALQKVGGERQCLEVGCEGGRWTEMLVAHGLAVTATDIDPTSLELCRQRVPAAKLVLVSPESTTLPGETGSFDLVFGIEVPVVNDQWFLAEAARLLRPGGIFICTVWNTRSWRGAAVSARSRLRDGRADAFYNVSYTRWRAQLRTCGFEVDHEEGVCWLPFSRESDSRLIPWLGRLEGALGLRRIPTLSPWVIVTARRH